MTVVHQPSLLLVVKLHDPLRPEGATMAGTMGLWLYSKVTKSVSKAARRVLAGQEVILQSASTHGCYAGELWLWCGTLPICVIC